MATIVETVTQVRQVYEAGVTKLAAATASANGYVASAFADLRFKFLPPLPTPAPLVSDHPGVAMLRRSRHGWGMLNCRRRWMPRPRGMRVAVVAVALAWGPSASPQTWRR